MEYRISLFKSISDKSPCEISIPSLLEAIKNGEYREKIEKLRKESDQAKKGRIKLGLPAVTISGIFKNGHKAENIENHSGLLQIDFDKVQNLIETLKTLKTDKYTFACFISPSGNGIKVIVKIQANIFLHNQHFNCLEQYYLKKYNLKADPQCKDLSRLMFVSYDENLFHNPNSFQWDIDVALFQKALEKTEKNNSFIQGKRNDFIFILACNCRDKGLSIETTLSEILHRYKSESLTTNEITSTIKSAYSCNKEKKYEQEKVSILESETKSEKYLSKLEQVESFINEHYEIRNNIVSCQIEYRPKESKQDFESMNENTVWRNLELKGISYSISKLKSLLNSDFVPIFNPIQSYFDSLGRWNENEDDYISNLCAYIPAKNKLFFENQFRKWLVRTVACSLNENIVNKQAFILVHPLHSSGKSTFCRWLCPPKLKRYYSDSFSFDNEGQNKLDSNFIINLDELSSIHKFDINALKSIMSMQYIKSRLKYSPRDSFRYRRANFVGSTNKIDFLTDETGSVRWLCIELSEKINFAYSIELDIDNIWRQAYHLYKSGFKFELSTTEENEIQKINKQFQYYSPERELICELFEPCDKESSTECIPASSIENELKKKYPQFRLNSQAIGKELTFLGFKKGRYKEEINGYRNHGYYVKRK